ncbi:hypothetical protein FA13DRAFT_1739680 [Coprinellus micaceus]|uniref:Uncharacterized protein n=1 Tax=Coprinellus micaceus TaxID=71717 RepID=A0A4Y7SQ90_COPMI|nr:hypothetical protein FA13DRAFT_1739680 [Coprinellus micaceus]
MGDSGELSGTLASSKREESPTHDVWRPTTPFKAEFRERTNLIHFASSNMGKHGRKSDTPVIWALIVQPFGAGGVISAYGTL